MLNHTDEESGKTTDGHGWTQILHEGTEQTEQDGKWPVDWQNHWGRIIMVKSLMAK
jgi:hypothetical protein